MKKQIITTFILALFISGSVIAEQFDFDKAIKEGDPEHKKKRMEWIEEMNRIQEDTDWRILNYETRMSKYENLNRIDKHNKTQYANNRIKGEWIEKGSNNQSGRIMTADIDFENNLLYVISQGGNVWRCTMDKWDWESLNDGLKFNGSLIRIFDMGDDPNRIFVASNRKVYISPADEINFEAATGLENLLKWGGVRRCVVTNEAEPKIYLLTNEWDYDDWHSVTKVYISRDKGSSFEVIRQYSAQAGKIDIFAPRYDDSRAYMMHNDTLFTITDANFNNYFVADGDLGASDMDDYNRLLLKGSVDVDPIIVAAFRSAAGGLHDIYVSKDYGQNWEITGSVETNSFTSNSFRVSYQDPETMFFGGVECYRSDDNGENWEIINKWDHYYGDPENKLHADIPAIDIFRDGNGDEITLISTDGGIYISYDQGHTVKNISLMDLNVSQYYDVLTSDNYNTVIYAGSQDQGFQRCQLDSGGAVGFKQTISGDYGHLTTSDGGSTLWSVYPGFAMLYKNAEEKMNRYGWDFEGKGQNWIPQIVADPANPNKAFIAAGGIDTTSNLWELAFDGQITSTRFDYDFSQPGSGTKLTAIGVSEIKPNTIYGLTNDGKFLASEDRGLSWTQSVDFEGPGGHYFYGSCVLPSKLNYGIVYVAGSGYSNDGVYVTTDNGKTFSAITRGLPSTLVYVIAQSDDEQLIFAATAVGPYVYVVPDSTWYDLSEGNAPDQTYWSVEYVSGLNTARFATYGRGIWDFRVDEVILSVPETHPSLVTDISIKAEPNPVLEGTQFTITTDLENEGSIRIYDIEGRMVFEVYKGLIPSGESKYDWSLTNTNLPAGSYMAVLSTGGLSQFVKIIISK